MPDEPGDGTASAQAGAEGGWLLAGRYRVVDRLGSGAMADVYRAHDETLDRDVAVKVFRAPMDGDADTAGAARRELELQAMAQLAHPNLVTLFDGSVSDDGPSFLALELVEGPNLATVLRDGPLPEPQVRRIGAQIADALAYVHERGMVHRDVKPANILLGSDSSTDPGAVRARLSDFGIVRLVDSAQVTAADLTVGTAYYLAPEQARSAAVGPPADVYSLGLVLLEALTGRRPFEGGVPEVLVARLSRDPEIPGDLPEPWPGLLPAMTAQDPERRPSAGEVAAALRTGSNAMLTPAAGLAGGAAAAAPLAAAAAAAPFAAAVTPTSADATPTEAVPGGAALGSAAAAGGFAAAAGAGAAAGAARPDAPTVAAQPPGAFAAAPVGGPEGPPPGPGPEDEPAKHHLTGLLVTAAAFLVIIAAAGWFLFRPSSHGTVPQQGSPGQSTTSSTAGGPSGSGSATGGRKSTRAVPVAEQNSEGSGGGAGGGGGPAPSRTPTARPSTNAASRTSSAPSTTAAPTTRSTPTHTRTASSSSAPPSTTRPTPTTSAAPTTTSSTSSAPTAQSTAPRSTTSPESSGTVAAVSGS